VKRLKKAESLLWQGKMGASQFCQNINTIQ